MRFAILLFYILHTGTTTGQTLPPVGQWREHLPYNRVLAVQEIEGIIWAATSNALFSVDPADNTIERVTRMSGLTGTDIRTVGTDGIRLMVIYSDGNIDIVDEDGITNIPDIISDASISNKSLNHVYTSGQKTWIAGTEAIYQLDIEKYEVRDTYIIGTNGSKLRVNYLQVHHDSLFAATADGLRAASLNNNNLSDFRNWYLQPGIEGNINNVITWSDQLVCRIADTIFIRDQTGWTPFYTGHAVTWISIENNQLIISEAAVGNSQVTIFPEASAAPEHIRHTSIKYPRQVIKHNEAYWIADSIAGLLSASGGTVQAYIPSSPTIHTGKVLASNQEKTVFAGGTKVSAGAGVQQAELSIFSEEQWSNFNSATAPALVNIAAFVTTVIDPADGSVWAGSNGSGLFHFKSGNIDRFAANSLINESVFNPGDYIVTGLAFDNSRSLWITNAGADKNLTVKKTDGTTVAFKIPFPLIDNGVKNLVIDQLDQKWLIGPTGNGLIAFNHGQLPENTADDQWKWYRTGTGNGNLPSDNVNCVAIDKDGFVWVGTDAGIAIIRCVSELFTATGCDAFRPVVRQDNFAGYLFAAENVQAIAVDGANRKWVGTKNGVWLLSADGEKIIYRFTNKNSPLLSNVISSISIDPKTGEVYIATEAGLCSFRSTATDSEVRDSPLLIFPNPVPPQFNGTIAIRGVPHNAIVKITELNGTLVFQTRALGAQAVWNGKDYRGRKISSGVYLVLISDDNKTEHAAGKIIFINR